jgi:antitoxin component YwqK of YwqJK toxin-antitoxin module
MTIKRNSMLKSLVIVAFILIISSCKNKFVNEYWDNGFLKKEISYEPYRDKGKYIVVKLFDRNCLDTCKRYYLMRYYPSGQLESRGRIYYGKKNGVWESWHENGIKSLEENYYNGQSIGKYRSWYPNGKVLEEFDFGFNDTLTSK